MKTNKNSLIKIYFIFILVILIFGSVLISAQLTSKNKLDNYDVKNRIGVISDNNDNVIAIIQLKTPQFYEVNPGYSKVAEFTIDSQIDYNSIINGFQFIDLNKNKVVFKSIDIMMLSTSQVLVPDYKETCSKDFFNRSHITCNLKQIGEHYENKYTWVPFNNNVKSRKPITIGLFTFVGLNDKVEWVPIIASVKINEWAAWGSSLNSGLMSYYKFDGTTGTNVSDIVRGRNGVSRYNDLWVLGKINNSMRFNYTNGVGNNFNNVNVTLSIAGITQTNTTENMSVTSWSTTGDTAAYGYVMVVSKTQNLTAVEKPSENTYTTARLRDNSSNDIATAAFVGDWATFSPPQLLTAGVSYQIVVYDGGAAATLTYKTTATYPLTLTNLSFSNFGCSSSQYCALQAFNLSYSSTGIGIIDGIGNFTDNATFGGWVNSTNLTGLHFVLGQKTVGVANGLNLNINEGIASCQIGGSGSTDSTNAIRANTWEHLMCVKNTTSISLYVNGVLNSTSVASTNIQMPNKTMYFGVYGDGYYDNPALDGNWFSGNIDELAFWNRSLDASEITELYNNGDGCSYQICFINSSIQLLNPINAQFVGSTDVNFSLIPKSSDTPTGLNISVYIFNQTSYITTLSNTSAYNITQTNFTTTLTDLVNYTWYSTLSDSLGVHYSVNRSFKVQVPPPSPPTQLYAFTNISMGFNEHNNYYQNLSLYWTNMTDGINHMEFIIYDQDILQNQNISTRIGTYPLVDGQNNTQNLLMKDVWINTTGYTISNTTEIPYSFEVYSFSENNTYYVTPWGCKERHNPNSSIDQYCTEGTPFYIIISDENVTGVQEGSGFLASLASSLSSIFPTTSGLSNTQKLGVVVTIILITNAIIFLGGFTFLTGSTLVLISGIATAIEFIYFAVNGYVPGGLLLLIGLIIVAIVLLKNRNK